MDAWTWPKVFAQTDSERFDVAFAEAINERFASLPLEDACEGGFPDPKDGVNVYDIKKVEDEDVIAVTFSLSFTESRTACGGGVHDATRLMDCKLTYSKRSGDCMIENQAVGEFEPEF